MAITAHEKRLYWHSRRGMLELDLVLVPFFKACYTGLDEEDKALYERLLACEDQDLFKWFLKREKPEDPALCRIVSLIIAHARNSDT